MADEMSDPVLHEEPAAGGQAASRRPAVTALGWTAVMLLALVVAVLTVALAGLLLVVSVWLAVVVPVVVLLLVVGIAAWARRA